MEEEYRDVVDCDATLVMPLFFALKLAVLYFAGSYAVTRQGSLVLPEARSE